MSAEPLAHEPSRLDTVMRVLATILIIALCCAGLYVMAGIPDSQLSQTQVDH